MATAEPPEKPSTILPIESLLRLARWYAAGAALIYFVDLLRQTRAHLTDGAGRPFGDDFVNYWTAASLAVHHRAAEIYNAVAFHLAQQAVVGPALGGFHYSYPPVTLVLTAPLDALPYVPALAAWLVAGWLAFYLVVRAIAPRHALLLALATPAVFVNAVNGQNGTWTAALLGGGLVLLDRRPLLAGSLLGLLVYKPQFGILIPIALLAGRRWRAFGAAAAVALGIVALSALWLGPDIYADYFRQADMLRRLVLEEGVGVWHRMMSVFVVARRLGADVTTAYVVQAAFALAAAAVVAVLWLRDAPASIRNAALVLGTCIATPYLQDYDLVFGALVVVWFAKLGADDARASRQVFVASALLLLGPIVNAALSKSTGVSFGALFILPAFAIVAEHAWRASAVHAVRKTV
jgi:hypothetical protein